MNGLETSLYELTRLFLLPVLLLILAALAYAFVALGGFAMEA
ncbi:biopolymer transporter ExbD, partial [Pseudomonas aeruginosa]